MLPELLWIVGLYVAAALLVSAIVRRSSRKGRRHYVLVAGNHQMQIEGYIRTLQHFSRRTGTDIGITVLLDRSTDETGPILERMARRDSGIAWVRRNDSEIDRQEYEKGCERAEETVEPSAADSRVVWLELGHHEGMKRLPL